MLGGAGWLLGGEGWLLGGAGWLLGGAVGKGYDLTMILCFWMIYAYNEKIL